MNYYKNSQEVAETRHLYYQLRIRISQLAHVRQMPDQEYIYFLLENYEA